MVLLLFGQESEISSQNIQRDTAVHRAVKWERGVVAEMLVAGQIIRGFIICL